MQKKLKLEFVSEKFGDFLEKIKDVSGIAEVVKFKISPDEILIYSLASTDSFISALKSYTLPTNEYIKNFSIDRETLDFIAQPASKMVKSLLFFDPSHHIYLDISYKESMAYENAYEIRSIQFICHKLKVTWISSENSQIRDLNTQMLEKKLDTGLAKWGFRISSQDFISIKKLSSINVDDRVLNISLNSSKVSISELGKWEMEVDTLTGSPDANISFLKKYLGSIDTSPEWINFWIFDTFILVKGPNTNLMLSYEQNFEQ
jgi:hypothetical protein